MRLARLQRPSTRPDAPRLGAALAVLLLLSACASQSDGQGQGGMNASRNANPSRPQEASAVQSTPDPAQARNRAMLRLQLASGYFQQGQNTVALEEIQQALAADPNFSDAYTLRGLVYIRLDDPAQAEDSFRRAIAINPRDGNALQNYGLLLCQQKRWGDAQRQFTRALDTPGYTDRGKTLLSQGWCQMQAGQTADAERSLGQAYELDPNNPAIGYNLAALHAQRNDWPRAQFYIRRVNASPSANAESLWLGLKVERQLNNREAAAQLGAQLQRRFPQSKEALSLERGNFND